MIQTTEEIKVFTVIQEILSKHIKDENERSMMATELTETVMEKMANMIAEEPLGDDYSSRGESSYWNL